MDGFLLGAIIIGSVVGASFLSLILSIIVWPPQEHHHIPRSHARRRALSRTIDSTSIVTASVPVEPIASNHYSTEEHDGSSLYGESEIDIENPHLIDSHPPSAVAVILKSDPIVHVIPKIITKDEEIGEASQLIVQPVICI